MTHYCHTFPQLHVYQPYHSLRSSGEKQKYFTTKVPWKNLRAYSHRSYRYQAPTVWNSLPSAIHQSASLASFKTNLWTRLFVKSSHNSNYSTRPSSWQIQWGRWRGRVCVCVCVCEGKFHCWVSESKCTCRVFWCYWIFCLCTKEHWCMLGIHDTMCVILYILAYVYMWVYMCVGDAFQIYYSFCTTLGWCTWVKTGFIYYHY